MALPSGFEGPTEYFEEFINFLQKYDHLYNFPNTDLLLVNNLDKIEVDTAKKDVLKDSDIFNANDKYLKDFFQHLDRLKVRYDEFQNNESLEFLSEVPLSQKKKHEIAYLAKEIDNVCRNIKCDTVVDFGSGLGYLDEQLFKTTNYNVLGLECNDAYYVGAKKRQRKYHEDSVKRIKYIKHNINQESSNNIKEFVKDKFPNSNCFCIAGLHACADLTIDAMNIFLKMEHARALIIMPCCYHRIMVDNSRNGRFKNFPLSHALKHVYEKYNGFNYLKVPFLRLATQPPNVMTEKLENLVFNLLARATLQLYAFKHNCILKRNKRKAVRLKTLENSFETYANNAVNGFKLLHNEANDKSEMNKSLLEEKINVEELSDVWRQISKSTFTKAAIFVLLQNHMQPIFENFVLYDRLVYLQENGIQNCSFKRILNVNISPRCLALIAQK